MIPQHPLVIHLPLALSLILPILVVAFAIFIKKNKMVDSSWTIIVGLQVLLTVSGYIALETGETDEDRVEKIVEHKLIHEHEEAAEMFVGSTVIALVLGITLMFLKQELQFKLRMVVALMTLVSAGLGFSTGKKGGELVYHHGAADAYGKDELNASEAPSEAILPTPGQETSESHAPDETDYDDREGVVTEEELKGED